MNLLANRLRALRGAAIANRDRNLVAEIEQEMARNGIPVDPTETTVDATVYETATPPRPRGRPRKVPT